jgi:hypothetical protein
MSSKADKPAAAGPQSIEELTGRYQKLHTRKIQADTNLQHAQERLKALKEDALEKYETDDLDLLRQKLADMTEQNEVKRRQYQEDLDQIEAELAAVEKKFDASTNEETK